MDNSINTTGSEGSINAKALRLKELISEVGTHPAVLLLVLPRLEEHLAAFSDLQMSPEEKKALLSKAKELMELSTELGRLPDVRAKAVEEYEKRLSNNQ